MTRSIDDDDSSTDSEEQPDQNLPSMRTRSRTRAMNTAHVATTPNIIGREIQAEMQQAYVAEVQAEEDNLSRMDPAPFLPAPDKWQQVLKLPTNVRKAWTKSFIKELKEILKKDTVRRDQPNPGDPIIPVTAKFRVKLNPDGTIEKLKTRIALRGDMMSGPTNANEAWCPIAGFRALKMFLAFAAMIKARIYQLDYVAAFLQADVLGRKFTTFPNTWKELLEGEPELQKWCGIPLRLNKSLYGDRVANLAWDKTQSQWLTSPEIGFSRLPSEGSIYIKRVGDDIIVVLNAVDDQCYFSTSNELKVWFEEATQKRFDVQLLGQAQWYLQSRITQCADYSIILDQSRYAALIIERYLPNLPSKTLTPRSIKAYEAPLPPTAVFTKKDCSENYLDVQKLEEEFGFEYAAVIGSLIYLMNTFTRLVYGIRKLARYMQYPGKTHFKLLSHLLHHIHLHRCKAGIKFYSELKLSPIYQHMKDTGNEEMAGQPIVTFVDSSFQDCNDTGRSTGGYMVAMQGGIVDSPSIMPPIVANSSCEAEYNMFALAIMGSYFVRKVYNELNGFDSDHPITIPMGTDSKSAIDTANSERETQRTRHIARRYHFVRSEVATSQVKLFKIAGTCNPADALTKPLPAEQLKKETPFFEVEVDP